MKIMTMFKSDGRTPTVRLEARRVRDEVGYRNFPYLAKSNIKIQIKTSSKWNNGHWKIF